MRAILVLFAAVLAAAPAQGAVWYLTGKVVMADGSPLPKPVGIERYCGRGTDRWETRTDREGNYVLRRIEEDLFGHLSQFAQMLRSDSMNCVLRASLSGYQSTAVTFYERGPNADPHLPAIVLYKRGSAALIETASEDVPRRAVKAWNSAASALNSRNFPLAERELRSAVEKAPRFAAAWNALGLVCQDQKKTAEARQAFRRAIEADPKLLGPYVMLTRLDVQAADWDAAAKDAAALIAADTKQRYPEAYLHAAVAAYYQRDNEGAERSARTAVRLDTTSRIPRARYVLGLILEARHDYAGAAEQMQQYLALSPKAADGGEVRARIANLGRASAESAPDVGAVDLNFPVTGEVWIPGGMKALATVANIERPASYENFFAEYCRTLVRFTSASERDSFAAGTGVHGYLESLQAYFAVVTELARLGEQRGDRTVMTLNLADRKRRQRTERILESLGWKVVEGAEGISIEIGSRPEDAVRQPIAAALGIDEVTMQRALEAGKTFDVEIRSETAALVGGDVWNGVLPGQLPWPGGLAESFTRDLRLARTYAGLSAAGPDTAATIVAAAGLRALIERHSGVLGFYADAFALDGKAAATPGGPQAAQVWANLAGASPSDAPSFFRAVLQFDGGKLAEFYCAVSRLDAAHQRYLTSSPERARAFYRWARESAGNLPAGPKTDTKIRETLQNLPLDSSGGLRFPGGRTPWPVPRDGEAVPSSDLLEKLGAVARVEMRRGRPLDDGSVRLILVNFVGWGPLFPYFERLSGLGQPDFEALAGFETAVRKLDSGRRERVLGQWHSLVELSAIGGETGGLDASTAARGFRLACKLAAGGPDGIAILREILRGPADLDEAVRSALLRLEGARRTRFARVAAVQKIPRLDTPFGSDDPRQVTALAGLVYGFRADPDTLLFAEDPLVVSRHRFSGPERSSGPVFLRSELNASSKAPGTRFVGGFAGFEDALRALQGAGPSDAAAEESETGPVRVANPLPGSARATAETAGAGAVFRADARLVEVHASVTDRRGRYIDDLQAGDFTILDGGNPSAVTAFEPRNSEVSCALLLDTTLSMAQTLPALKNAAVKLIAELRPSDSVAVYGFANTVSLLEPFTTDKAAAQRAVLRTQARGETALFDALVRVSRDLAARRGKKVIVLFTDGDDNLSTLSAGIAIERVKRAGVPVHTVAQGVAFVFPVLLDELAAISAGTGGLPFRIEHPREIGRVFEQIAQDLTHGYLMVFRPASQGGSGWRAIAVDVKRPGGYKVRAREGYYP